MVNSRRCGLVLAAWLGILSSLPAAGSPLSAQERPQVEARAGTSLRCESSGAYQRCPASNNWRGARLVQQLSSNPCIQGRTWGFDRDAIWVNNGCRGVFDAGDPFTNAGERVTCAGSGRTECPGDTRYGVTLVRKLSDAACTQNVTWGYQDNAVWVDRGCRAEFLFGAAPAGDGTGTAKAITCGSSTGLQVTCRTEGYATDVRLVRDLSGGRCREGETWGHTDSFIWANRGCRGYFEATLQGGPGQEQTGTAIISCGTTTGRQVACDTEGDAVDVRLRQDQSGGRCREGASWGHTESFVWTSQGCRGEFEVTYRGGAPGAGVMTRRITCGTSDQSRLSCRPGGNVSTASLARELSVGKCRQNSSWGFGGDSLWVGNGCSAEFTVSVGGTAGAGHVGALTCGSTSGQRMTCSTQGRASDVRLVTDFSGGRCREGSSWGHTDTYVWAANGCRGRFEITYARVP